MGPIPRLASTTKRMASTSFRASKATLHMYSPRRFFGVVTPGVSKKTICRPGRVSTPITRFRVVWARWDTMDTFCPIIWFIRVLFPTLGEPMMDMNPDR